MNDTMLSALARELFFAAGGHAMPASGSSRSRRTAMIRRCVARILHEGRASNFEGIARTMGLRCHSSISHMLHHTISDDESQTHAYLIHLLLSGVIVAPPSVVHALRAAEHESNRP